MRFLPMAKNITPGKFKALSFPETIFRRLKLNYYITPDLVQHILLVARLYT